MPTDFYDYFPVAEQHLRWGISATSYGQVRIPAGSHYPPEAHPRNHTFSWEKGRVLQEYQLVYVVKGGGEFESAFSASQTVGEGTIFVLFPGVWHRYRPAPETGWTECWLELQGAQLEELRRTQVLDPARPIHPVGDAPEFLAAWTAAGQIARAKPAGFQVRLGLLGLQILTHLHWPPAEPGSPSQRIEQIIQEALHLLAANLDQPLSPEWIAKELHVGYSYFRRMFKTRTGFTPKQYRLEIRFRRTCDFLRHTDLTLKEIAPRLGYDSPYHLSTDFKQRMGVSPQKWRGSVCGGG